MTLKFRKLIESRHCLFILKNVASLCKVSHFAVSATEFFRLYDPCVTLKIGLINSAFLRETGFYKYSEPSKRAI